jgi:hypothetical protein
MKATSKSFFPYSTLEVGAQAGTRKLVQAPDSKRPLEAKTIFTFEAKEARRTPHRSGMFSGSKGGE